jgi:hypothetical protein
MVFVLKSVGTAFNTSTGMLYPINNDESFDTENGININKDEVSTEWLEALSDEDLNVISNFIIE